MFDFELSKENAVYIHLDCNNYAIEKELSQFLSCKAKDYRFHPKFKTGQWDGTIYYYNIRQSLLPIGLFALFVHFCKTKNYTYNLKFDKSELQTNLKASDLIEIFQLIFKNSNFELRKYQTEAIENAIKYHRGIIRAATGSGKSIIIYVLVRYLLMQNRNVLLTCPTTTLVEQIFGDFIDYGWIDCEKYVCKLYSSQIYDEDKPVLISTWQSAYRKDQSFFNRFGGLMMDECFHPKTMITMADKTKKQIENVNVGDMVISKNNESNLFEPKEVRKKHKNITHHRNELYFIETDQGKVVFPQGVTGNHKVYTKNRGEVRVDSLIEGDELVNHET